MENYWTDRRLIRVLFVLLFVAVVGWVYYDERVDNLEQDLTTTCRQLVGLADFGYEPTQQVAPWCTDERLGSRRLYPEPSPS